MRKGGYGFLRGSRAKSPTGVARVGYGWDAFPWRLLLPRGRNATLGTTPVKHLSPRELAFCGAVQARGYHSVRNQTRGEGRGVIIP